MATTSKLDHHLDDAQSARVDMLGRVEQAMALMARASRVNRDVWDDLAALRDELAGGDEQGRGGGPLYAAICEARESRKRRRSAGAVAQAGEAAA